VAGHPLDGLLGLLHRDLHVLDHRVDLLAELAVRPERSRTSSATTAKPRPASPARAASIAAFSASRLVCLAIEPISERNGLHVLGARHDVVGQIDQFDAELAVVRRCCRPRAA
jgi:hypothetical protein